MPGRRLPQTYLGLPLSTAKITTATLDAIAVKLEHAVPGWRTTLPNRAGRLTLVESVLTAEAIYAMSVLPFPLTALAKLDRPRKELFWAGATKCGGGACQVAWDLACRSRGDGGLGLRDLATMNKSLMMKHIHKLFAGDSNPWADWIRFWYDGGQAGGDTPCWRDIKKLIPEYRTIMAVALGDGDSTFFWHDTWSEAGILHDALRTLYSHCTDTDLTVAEVVLAGGMDSALQPRLSSTAQAERELLMNALSDIELNDARDTRWIRGSPSSNIRAAGIYNALWALIGGPPMARVNWECFAPKKVKIFFWILRHERTRTRASLHRHGARDSPDCPFCPGVTEEADHLFVTCPRLVNHWSHLLPEQKPPSSIQGAVAAICSAFAAPDTAAHTAAVGVLWIIWKAQNAMVFHNLQEDAPTMARHLQQHIELWVCRAPRRLDV
ncbi:hypothetical protein HU200_020482 [Digitaria exilis]|uniref:Reverse transcriptase zinc-binding domain-containing protein n=1 Tax=Digitaria exilis TaxID=1010633 RepID=A0A835KBS7_9POAL|nr:hypothetical protein HU200_020482 [Digitaria exilis]CAB3463966.1 unnamed protein product [Digitaria exilis]